jgi:phenylalanyl-tRNA synthetase beta chain
MPKIELNQDALFRYAGQRYTDDELESILTAAKAELDEPADADGTVKIELNDTNRPDLWSTAGLGRQLRVYAGGDIPQYRFFSRREASHETGDRRIVVDPVLKDIRPFIAGFVIQGDPIDEILLKDIIQTQEKLCWNYGRKRSSIAMGIYRNDLIRYPVRYRAADPDATAFTPLGLPENMSLRRILTDHPKGREFGSIVADFPAFPFLTDDEGEVLSFPPVINSERIGAVQEGDRDLFIELTGTDMPSLLTACSIVACDFADAGYTVLPVTVEYPYDTPEGRTVVTPFYFQRPMGVTQEHASKLLGRDLLVEEMCSGLARMGISSRPGENGVTVFPPEYRNDFLHPVDVIEDVMIGCGMATFGALSPSDFTVGRLSRVEEFSRQVKSVMVGLGYQEMIFNYLGSATDFIGRMYPGQLRDDMESRMVRISNPMSENFEYVRNSAFPHLLGAEAVSAHAVYPHKVFEIGKVAVRDDSDNYGSVTKNILSFLIADLDAGFNLVTAHLAALMYCISVEYTVQETDDPRFIPGRAGTILHDGDAIGVFGEIHPTVLENWGIEMPVAACEFDLGRVVH